MRKVLVTAAGGNQGKLLIPKLSAAGISVRALRATAGKDAELEALGADEVLVGDLGDVDAYARALEGCDAVYHIGPGGADDEVQKGLALIEAANRCGTRHVVMSSCHYSIVNIVQHRAKRDIEEKLYESYLNYTILKPCDFMMPVLHIDPVLKTGALPVWWKIRPDRRGSLIAVEDLVDVAAKVIIEGDAHFHAEYDLSGPDKLTPQEMARVLSRVMGQDIQPLQWTPDDLFEFIFGVREPAPQFKHFHEILWSISNWYSEHEFVGNPNILEWLLGRKPTTFEQWVTRELAQRSA